MSTVTVATQTAEETQAVAARVAALLHPGDVITLAGDLGAGKTTWTRGLCVALGVVANRVTSPTFTLLHEYRGGRLPVYHADAYRLTQAADADDIGLIDVINVGDGVVVVDWAERIAGALPGERLDILLADTGGDTRTITLAGRGERWANLATDWSGETC